MITFILLLCIINMIYTYYINTLKTTITIEMVSGNPLFDEKKTFLWARLLITRTNRVANGFDYKEKIDLITTVSVNYLDEFYNGEERYEEKFYNLLSSRDFINGLKETIKTANPDRIQFYDLFDKEKDHRAYQHVTSITESMKDESWIKIKKNILSTTDLNTPL